MTKWNEIPFNESDTPQQKADQFDAQIAENAAATPQETTEELRLRYEAEDENRG